MMSFREAFAMTKALGGKFAQLKETDVRNAVYCQEINSVGSGSTGAGVQQFPNGAILYGILADAYVNGAAAASGQSSNNRQLFGLTFSFTGTGEFLTPPGTIYMNARSLLGNEDTIFPKKVIVLGANQNINAGVKNFTTTTLNVQIAYHCFVFRFQG